MQITTCLDTSMADGLLSVFRNSANSPPTCWLSILVRLVSFFELTSFCESTYPKQKKPPFSVKIMLTDPNKRIPLSDFVRVMNIHISSNLLAQHTLAYSLQYHCYNLFVVIGHSLQLASWTWMYLTFWILSELSVFFCPSAVSSFLQISKRMALQQPWNSAICSDKYKSDLNQI